MAQTAPPLSTEVSQIGRWSLAAFAIGLLGPFLIALGIAAVNAFAPKPMAGVDPTFVGVWFGLAAQALAFVLGLVGRRSKAGQVALVGSGLVFLFIIGSGVLWAIQAHRYNGSVP